MTAFAVSLSACVYIYVYNDSEEYNYIVIDVIWIYVRKTI